MMLLTLITLLVPVVNSVDMSIARECLQKTHPNVTLAYPDDALEHYHDIHNSLKRFYENVGPHCYAKYCGPWIENFFIRTFKPRAENGTLQDTFGPFIPILIPWTDILQHGKGKYDKAFTDVLANKLRDNVAYITVSQNDRGLQWNAPNNLIVMSAGGYGHIPVPLIMSVHEPLQLDCKHDTYDTFISYVGGLNHAPHNMRNRMHAAIERSAKALGVSYKYFYGKDWMTVMDNSAFSLAPRGYGRTAFHLIEILQRGLIPIHVFLDIPWVPYSDLFESFGFTTNLQDIPALLEKLTAMTWKERLAMLKRIRHYRQTHFLPDGIMDQIKRFFKGNCSDLVCQQLPKSERAEETQYENIKSKNKDASCDMKLWDPSPLPESFWTPIVYDDHSQPTCDLSLCLTPKAAPQDNIVENFQLLTHSLVLATWHEQHPTVVFNDVLGKIFSGFPLQTSTTPWGCFASSQEACNKTKSTGLNLTIDQVLQGKLPGVRSIDNFSFARFLGKVVSQILMRAPKNIRVAADNFAKINLSCRKYTAIRLSGCHQTASTKSLPTMFDHFMEHDDVVKDASCLSDKYLQYHLMGHKDNILVIYDAQDSETLQRVSELKKKYHASTYSSDNFIESTFVQMVLAVRATHFIGDKNDAFSKLVAAARAYAFKEYLPSNIRITNY
eukprot:m.12001 g.12001  ORF g.12001 m.12001 type:complete len:667 (+) comp4568_c0_seq1:300-2300(+)